MNSLKLLESKVNDNRIPKRVIDTTIPTKTIKTPYSVGIANYDLYTTTAYDLYRCSACGRNERYPTPRYYEPNLTCWCQYHKNIIYLMEFIKVVPAYGCTLQYKETKIRI